VKEVEEAEVEAEFWRIVDNVREAIDKRTPPTEDVMVRPSISINSSALQLVVDREPTCMST
jgi:hypothetical protein